MDNWKNIDKYGRYGDTMSKKIDGDIAHVNAVEYEMSPEYIKEHGSGTINPITGKREYFDPISLTMAAVSLGSMAYKGFQNVSGRDDRSAGLRAADEQYALKKGRLDKDIRDKNIYIDHTYQSGMEKAKSAWDFAGKTLDIGTEKTIASGAITVTHSFHSVDTEGDAGTDDLDTINGGKLGQLVTLIPANGSRTVVMKDGTGNLKLSGDFNLNGANDNITLLYTGSEWVEISTANNA